MPLSASCPSLLGPQLAAMVFASVTLSRGSFRSGSPSPFSRENARKKTKNKVSMENKKTPIRSRAAWTPRRGVASSVARGQTSGPLHFPGRLSARTGALWPPAPAPRPLPPRVAKGAPRAGDWTREDGWLERCRGSRPTSWHAARSLRIPSLTAKSSFAPSKSRRSRTWAPRRTSSTLWTCPTTRSASSKCVACPPCPHPAFCASPFVGMGWRRCGRMPVVLLLALDITDPRRAAPRTLSRIFLS